MIAAYVGGAEIDRIAGRQLPRSFVAWVDALSRGVTSRETHSKIEARRSQARELVRVGDLDGATAEFSQLWQQITDSLWRRTLASEARRLIARHAPAREVFASLRDRLAPVGEVDTEDLSDWVTLNSMLDDPAATPRWFDQLDKTKLPDPHWAFWTEREIVEILAAQDRWADAGAAISNPRSTLQRAHAPLLALRSHTDSE